MIKSKTYRVYRNSKKFGVKYLFWKLLSKIGLDPNNNIEKCMEKYYSRLSQKEMEEEKKNSFIERVGYPLNLDNPKTFDEKIQWLMLYDSTPLKTQLSDKYLVRDWVKAMIGEKYLIPLIGVWDSFDDINFSTLPEEYVLQCNHGSGMNIIVRKNQPLQIEKAKKKINRWLKINYGLNSLLELHYKNIKPRIIATKYIENIAGDLYDYKFYCFNGTVRFINVIRGRYYNERISFYDLNWNKQTFYNTAGSVREDDKVLKKPEQLDQAIEIAEKLSKGFPFVRVDLYLVGEDEIFLGEMTFTPAAGIMPWVPISADEFLGSFIELPKEKYIIK